MKHKLKIITLLTLGTLSATVVAQVPNTTPPQAGMVSSSTTTTVTSTGTKVEVPVVQNRINDYSQIGEGNAYEKAVTPLLREISRKKSILELKKLDKEIAKLDEVEKKDLPASNPYASIPAPTYPQMKSTAPTAPMVPVSSNISEGFSVSSSPIKVLMTYGDENDLYAKIAVGDQGGYTVRKDDILPDGRSVLKVSSNYIEVEQPVKSKKSRKITTQKIFVSSAVSSSALPGTGTNTSTITVLPSNNMPTLSPIPAINTATTTSLPSMPMR